MQKAYNDLLSSRLETALDAGAALILWNELYRWYEMKKIAVGTWRDLDQRWEEMVTHRGTKPGKLMCVDGPGGLWLFSDNTLRSVKEIANKEEL
jgi:hypothetical protein